MTDNKLTPEEIKKALECCISDENCENCPLYHQKIENACTLTVVEFYKEILALINSYEAERDTMLEDLQFRTNQVIEQQADIEAWKKINQQLYNEMEERRKEDIGIAKRYARIKAIKEFAERLKECCYHNDDLSNDDCLSMTSDIDNLVKEMVSEDK